MRNLNVKHYLDIYTTRKKMQEEGIINPKEEVQNFLKDFIEILQNMPLNEEIIMKDDSFLDSKGNHIIKIPDL